MSRHELFARENACDVCGEPANLHGERILCWGCSLQSSAARRNDVLAGKVHWGPWRFRPKSETIQHTDGYSLSLRHCIGSAGVLDRIAQIAGKCSYTAEDVGHLVRAFHELAHLQEHFCGGGEDRPTFDLLAHLRSGP